MSIDEVISKQRVFFNTDITKNVSYRIEALKKLRSAIIINEKKINEALKKDLNKSSFESYITEVGLVLNEISYVLKNIRKWSKIRHVHTPIIHFHSKSFVVPEPYGVVLLISPWNFPFQLCLEVLIGAIAGGNCAVVKPSGQSINTSHVIADLIGSCFPPEYVKVFEGDRERNTEILNQKYDYIFFTGGTTTGKHVMECASRNLTPVTLELGGKSPCIIDRTADLKLAAKRIVFGKFLSAGQSCVAPDYLLIQKSIGDEFIFHLKNAIEESFPGNDFTEMPTIINEKRFSHLLELMKGQKVFLGGGYVPERNFIEPTVLTDVQYDSPIMQEEIFGPLLPVIVFDEICEIIARLKVLPKPLNLYLFTTDKPTEDLILKSLSFGGGCINDTSIHFSTNHLAFGGVGDSGIGGYHGRFSFDTFTHYKNIMKKYNRIDLPMRYHPFTEKHLKFLKHFLK